MSKLQFLQEARSIRSTDFPNVFKTYFGGEDKTVLGTWNFVVSFTDKNVFDGVKPYHILDINIPMYKFNRNSVVYGSVPKSYATFDASGDGREFSVTFEEDNTGYVTSLVYAMQKNIMRQTGVYNYIKNQYLGNCVLDVYDSANTHVMRWIMNDIYFVGADDVSLQYASGDSMKVKITFGCDIISFENFSYSLV